VFTGIIDDIGTIITIENLGDTMLEIQTNYDLENIALGASISCSGVCLTVIKKDKNSFFAQVSDETLSCTTIGNWQIGDKINLERSMKIGDEIGGHIVSGHVDDIAKIISITQIDDSHEIKIIVGEDIKYLIAKKGSICINGVSLTVNDIRNNIFSINIIPYTWEHTSFKYLKVNDEVNIEIDMLARYIARYMESIKQVD
jgi:riboflavin synthase